jgi:hypothetical protein
VENIRMAEARPSWRCRRLGAESRSRC